MTLVNPALLSSAPHRATTVGVRAEVRRFLHGELQAGRFEPACDSWLTGWDEPFTRQVQPAPLACRQMFSERVHRVLQATTALRKPLIAATNDVAGGTGLDMALAVDFRFAGESVRSAKGYIPLRVVAGDGGCYSEVTPTVNAKFGRYRGLPPWVTIDDAAVPASPARRVADDTDDLLPEFAG
jgi:hypothetical protein